MISASRRSRSLPERRHHSVCNQRPLGVEHHVIVIVICIFTVQIWNEDDIGHRLHDDGSSIFRTGKLLLFSTLQVQRAVSYGVNGRARQPPAPRSRVTRTESPSAPVYGTATYSGMEAFVQKDVCDHQDLLPQSADSHRIQHSQA